MSDDAIIILTAVLVATSCGLLGPLLVLRRVALMGDAVSHAVLPGIIAAYLVTGTRDPLTMILGATVFAIICVLGIETLTRSGLVKADASIGIVFPALFAAGVIGIQRYAANVHIDLDSTIYGEIAFSPFRLMDVFGWEVPRSLVLTGSVAVLNLVLLLMFWKESKLTSFDESYAHATGFSPRLMARALLVATAVTAVTAFESVGAILVVALLIVSAAAARLLTNRLLTMVVVTVLIGWVSAIGGHGFAVRVDASIAGSMGLVAGAIFTLAMFLAPGHGLIARRVRRQRARRVARGHRPPAQLS